MTCSCSGANGSGVCGCYTVTYDCSNNECIIFAEDTPRIGWKLDLVVNGFNMKEVIAEAIHSVTCLSTCEVEIISETIQEALAVKMRFRQGDI